MDVVAKYFKLARPQYLPIVILPVLTGSAMACGFAAFFNPYFWLCLIGVGAAHLGANTANDYFDWMRGTDKICWEEKPNLSNELICGSKVLVRGELTLQQARIAMLVYFFVAFLSCTLLTIAMGWVVMLLGLAGFALGYFYCAPPVGYGYIGRGLGEVGVFLAFGLLPVVGSYYVLARVVTLDVVAASLPFGMFAALILYYHHFSHADVDGKAKKMSPPFVLGRKRALALGRFLTAVTFVLIVLLVVFNVYPWHAGIAALPPGILLVSGERYERMDDVLRMKQVVRVFLLSSLIIFLSFGVKGFFLSCKGGY